MSRHGGLWLLSDVDVEQQVANAVYRISWHNPLNEDDDSWLRRFLADARHQEPQHFAQMLRATSIGSDLLAEWQQHVASCACPDPDRGEPGCQVHATIQACHDYCDLIDADWQDRRLVPPWRQARSRYLGRAAVSRASAFSAVLDPTKSACPTSYGLSGGFHG